MAKVQGKFIDPTIFRKNSATGDGATTAFVLADTPIGSGALWVFVNGIEQQLTTDYSLAGDTVTFVTAPATAQSIDFSYIRGQKMAGKLQNEDFKTETELVTAGGTKSQLLNDTKVYVTGNGINKTLDDAIVDGDIGGGGTAGPSDLSIYQQYTAEDEDVTGFTNITTSGTSPLAGSFSYSVNAYPAAFAAATLDERNQGRENTVSLVYKMTSGTAKLVVKDQSSAVLVEQEISSSSSVQKVVLSFFASLSLTSVTLEIEDISSATGLVIDDVVFSDDPFISRNIFETHNYVASLNSSINISSVVQDTNGGLFSVDDSVATEMRITALKNISLTLGSHIRTSGDTLVRIFDPSNVVLSECDQDSNPTNSSTNATATYNLKPGETIRIDYIYTSTFLAATFHASAYEVSEHIITPAQAQPNVYAARISNPSGTSSVTSESSPFIQSVNTSSTGTVDIVWTPGLFTEAPSVTATIEGSGANDFVMVSTPTTSGVSVFTDRDNSALFNNNFSITVTRQGADYKENFGISAVPVQRTVYIKDVKGNGAEGGSALSGSWITRTLNTLEGDAALATLSSNQFTLAAGTYEVFASAPAFDVGSHKIRIQNITDATTALVGSTAYAAPNNPDLSQNHSVAVGRITIDSPKTFEFQHRVAISAGSTNGLGVGTGFGVDEIFAQIKLTKLIS